MQQISDELYNRLKYLGIIPDGLRPTRDHNVGQSDYSTHTIQPWSVWLDWNLDPWDADIVKRICRHKEGESPILDYEKIIHICQEKLRQLSTKDYIPRLHEISLETAPSITSLDYEM